MYELISATPSPYARKVRIALIEKGIPGGINWSLQHLEGGSCDDAETAGVGSIRSVATVITRATIGRGA